MMRVVTAGASGISTWSYVSPALCATPDRSAAQCGHVAARMSFTTVGCSHRGRCAPGWPQRGCVASAGGFAAAFGFAPCDGGTLEFRGVFFGRPSRARRTAISARCRSISASLALPSLCNRSFSARSRPFSACRAAFSSRICWSRRSRTFGATTMRAAICVIVQVKHRFRPNFNHRGHMPARMASPLPIGHVEPNDTSRHSRSGKAPLGVSNHYFHNDDMPLAAYNVMKPHNGTEIKLGGCDAMPPALAAVSDGRMLATVGNPSCRIHGGAIVAGVGAVVGGEKTGQGGIPKNIVTDGPVVTKANAPGMMWMEEHFLI